jgi:hypothetical protein
MLDNVRQAAAAVPASALSFLPDDFSVRPRLCQPIDICVRRANDG